MTTFPRYLYEPTRVDSDGRMLWGPSPIEVEPGDERRRLLTKLLTRDYEPSRKDTLIKEIDELSAEMIDDRRAMKAFASD